MNIICFGQQNWDLTWTEKQQHSVRLTRRGHRVLFVDPSPIPAGSLAEVARAAAPVMTRHGVREIEPGALFVYTPRWLPAVGYRVNVARQKHVLGRLARRLGFSNPTGLAFRPDVAPLVEAAGCTSLVYYAVDEWTTQCLPDEAAEIRAAEDALVHGAGVALGVSPRLVDRFRTIQPRSYMLENGVDPEHFAPAGQHGAPRHKELSRLPRPRLGLVGQIDHRVDQKLLLAVARLRPDWHIVLIGRVHPAVDAAALDAQPNIHRVPFQPYEALPSVLHELDVCLVPYRATEQAHACNPAKIFEYIAAGRPVVAAPLDGIVACREVVELAGTVEAFIAAVERCLNEPPARTARRLEVARQCHWERRTDELERRIHEARKVARSRARHSLHTAARARSTA